MAGRPSKSRNTIETWLQYLKPCYTPPVPHFFYLARCKDGSLYAGTCVDIEKREAKHNDGTGAKYTRSRLPIKIIYTEEFKTLSEARKREAEVKKWKKEKKEALPKS
jgi:putative endonuclease